jgi:hypothetical protein
MDKSNIKQQDSNQRRWMEQDSNQRRWIFEYLEKLTFILEDCKGDSYVDMKSYDASDHNKDNFRVAECFIKEFARMLLNGSLNCFFDIYKEQRLNAVVEEITVKFMNERIFHGDDTIHFFTSNKQLLFVYLLQALIEEKLSD